MFLLYQHNFDSKILHNMTEFFQCIVKMNFRFIWAKLVDCDKLFRSAFATIENKDIVTGCQIGGWLQ
jgi:hypothetical protein